ncbi:MAG: 4-alpha-glucanotransferase [Prevotella sp.]|nr:4-alpha-glucanotransferase [Prevotella sp.]
MKFCFFINYRTNWGESVHAIITSTNDNGRQRTHNVPLLSEDGDSWHTETVLMEMRKGQIRDISYHYQIEDSNGNIVRKEWNSIKRVVHCEADKNFLLYDFWRDTPLLWHLYTDVVRGKCSSGRIEKNKNRLPIYRKTVIFKVSAPQLADDEILAICGNHPSIGDWSPSRYIKMTYCGNHEWNLALNTENINHALEYKYVVVDRNTNRLRKWEEGDNRVTHFETLHDGQVAIEDGGSIHVMEKTWKASGVSVPLFSLRTKDSFGIGDMGDLLKTIDWCSMCGIRVIQLLPINDTGNSAGWNETNPYNSISAFAINPIYFDASELIPENSMERTEFNRRRMELEAYRHCDYKAVGNVKQIYIDYLFNKNGKREMSTDDYKEFSNNNAFWLNAYAIFKAMSKRHGTSDFRKWEVAANYEMGKLEKLLDDDSEMRKETEKVKYIQYRLNRQLAKASSYARKKGISLMCDMQTGFRLDSVEVWQHPDIFDMTMRMGIPPYDGDRNGQNWRFPIYIRCSEWEEWMRNRIKYLERYFDVMRIDHIAALFALWAIPQNNFTPVLGHFIPSLPLSAEEITGYGLTFRKELMTKPFVNDEEIERGFGIHADYVKEVFLNKLPYNMYGLKTEYDCQEKIENMFRDKQDENSIWIRDGLKRICTNVLFIEDEKYRNMYHPRVYGYNQPLFAVLSSNDRDAYMRIYNNYYGDRHQYLWKNNGEHTLLNILEDSKMLVCAEDMGYRPHGMDEVIEKLRILSTEVQTLPKNDYYEFGHTEAYPYRSIATTGTHDMPSLRVWWEEDKARVQRYYATRLHKEGIAPKSLPPRLAEEIIARHMYSPSMLCMICMQDWLAMDSILREDNVQCERINNPNDCFNKWDYRMGTTIDALLSSGTFNGKIKEMVARSKRLFKNLTVDSK